MWRAGLFALVFLMMRGGAPALVSSRSEQTSAAGSSAVARQGAPSAAQAGPRIIVLDPGHGGTDPGARGPSGVLEKDVVLAIARALRAELERQGLRVVLTHEGDDNPSFDDRAALANAQRGALFLTLHASSTGPVGTVRSYYLSLEELSQAKPAAAPAAGSTALLRWQEAQAPYAELSRRFAELLQVQLGLKFRGSPEVPAPSAIRQLRMVTAPAVAVEISSVSVSDAKTLESMTPDLAVALARAVEAFRPLYQTGGN